MAIYFKDDLVLFADGLVATSADCCCGVTCDHRPLTITFTGVTQPGCCVAIPASGGPSTTNVPCSGGSCFDFNQAAGWPLGVISPGVWGFSSSGGDTVTFQEFYDDEFCTIFDSSSNIPFDIFVFCDGAGIWRVDSFLFKATNITNPASPFPNEATCGEFDPMLFELYAGEDGTAVITF